MNPHRPGPSDHAALNERVREQFGGYATRSGAGFLDPEGPNEREILADDFLKPTLRIILGVAVASLFAFIATSPTFDAPNVWSNTFRFDTALVLVWGPLLAWTMAKLK